MTDHLWADRVDTRFPTYTDAIAAALTPEGHIDGATLERNAQRSTVTNGGVACDVRSGPCSCGAWH